MTAPLILLVEDNETNQMLAMTVLQRDGYRVDVAGSSEEATLRLAAARTDLILMDLQLPGQDGLSLTRALKEDPATNSIPIVAMTAHAMLGDADEALAAGCAGYIAKPIDTRVLGDQVRRYLAASKSAS